MSENGFEDLARQLNQIKIDKSVAQESLKQAADFYLEQLKPSIPTWAKGMHHAKNDVSVKVNDDNVQVIFGDKSYYWWFVENGTSKQRAQHFARNTLEQNKNKIEQIMAQKIERMIK
ncbi:MAG: HK97-gp10 family putative phage morphogenesis protein [Liquorilactobacillus ghanensis]|uniref:HK97-gp10 family putative phage morphogenesis protein n=1 Tax=Liquorilactobacillus ghanensis TaxID=399370 RepID=UPI0039EC2114